MREVAPLRIRVRVDKCSGQGGYEQAGLSCKGLRDLELSFKVVGDGRQQSQWVKLGLSLPARNDRVNIGVGNPIGAWGDAILT